MNKKAARNDAEKKTVTNEMDARGEEILRTDHRVSSIFLFQRPKVHSISPESHRSTLCEQ